jgi:hypothetical protein
MKKTSYIKAKYPIFKRNHEKIFICLKPDTPDSSYHNVKFLTTLDKINEELKKNENKLLQNKKVL